MDSNYKDYDYVASAKRIDDYLAQPAGNFTEVDSLPDRDKLTFTNGFYANCSAIFVDIRDSSSLPNHYDRPRLAKVYRAYLSEMVAIFNSDPGTREVNIAGDAVWAVVNTPYKKDIDDVFRFAYTANSLMQLLNKKMAAAGFKTPIKAGIGASWGRALMVKAGYNGSGINDVVYMGDVVNEAAHLAAKAHDGWQKPIFVSQVFYNNLNEDNQKLLAYNQTHRCYSGDVVLKSMSEWMDAQGF
ncbi:adenylate/guanylate cyclase domain-containing protein [Blastococcus sp. KM273129]|uniref:adenylate/guanylate cyclase domain-containing protein n=1 Tax=Blastococcus sp. KM273129 TaxID=2570315 RepID=UPI001F22CE0C|nr:adenylate/guanylate cyclase domain-containing protein [Blastococcus sp. KM273129]MCF6733712.1 adenylate/guanylate cyclase domain-containing protein [Blastococcus sp. KM273129]